METPPPAAIEVVRQFWRLMGTNDFASVASVLAPDFVLEWPQSSERIRGAARFVQMNAEYPAHGAWRFEIHRLFGDAEQVVSEVSGTDGVQSARPISFFRVQDGLIVRLEEFWPEPFEAAENRKHMTEPL